MHYEGQRMLIPATRLFLLFAVVLNAEAAVASSWQSRLQALIDDSAYRGLSVRPVSIFGDGNFSNGIEDDREGADQENHVEVVATAPVGMISCDGRITGSGTLLDVSSIQPQTAAAATPILATAAHVFYEESSGTPFNECLFRTNTADRLSVLIDLESRVSGRAGTADKFRNSAGEDWAFARLKNRVSGSPGVAPVISSFAESIDSKKVYILAAYDRWTDTVLLSRSCQIFTPHPDNLAGGSIKELLHDCDAIGGASGGAMLTALEGADRPVLVGIHLGHIWSKEKYPPAEFPKGPRDWGEKSDPGTNANYFRVFDQELLDELIRFVSLQVP